MAPRSALVLASFAVAFCAVVPCLGDEPAELPPLPAPVLSSAPPAAAPFEAPAAAGGESSAPPERPRIRSSTWSQETSLGAMAVGGGLVGAGWVLSVLHGVVGEIVGIDCGRAHGGPTAMISCRATDDYGPIYIPVVGPFLEAAEHKGTLSDADKGFLVIEGLLQAGGAVTALVGLASLPVTMRSDTVSVTVAPVVSAGGAGLGVTGSF